MCELGEGRREGREQKWAFSRGLKNPLEFQLFFFFFRLENCPNVDLDGPSGLTRQGPAGFDCPHSPTRSGCTCTWFLTGEWISSVRERLQLLIGPKVSRSYTVGFPDNCYKKWEYAVEFIHPNSGEIKKKMPTWWEKEQLKEPLGRGLFYHWLGWPFRRYTKWICEWHEAEVYSEYVAVQLECRWNFTGWNNKWNLLMLNLLCIVCQVPALGPNTVQVRAAKRLQNLNRQKIVWMKSGRGSQKLNIICDELTRVALVNIE